MVPVGKEELQDLTPVVMQLRTLCDYGHTILRRSGTRGEELIAPLRLNDAHATGAYRRKSLEETKRRNVNVIFAGDLKHGISELPLACLSIYGEGNFFHLRLPPKRLNLLNSVERAHFDASATLDAAILIYNVRSIAVAAYASDRAIAGTYSALPTTLWIYRVVDERDAGLGRATLL